MRVLEEEVEFHTVTSESISLIIFNMNYKLKEELVGKVGVLGTGDLIKLAPIGDLGYANGWYPHPLLKYQGTFMNGGLERIIFTAAREQGFEFRCISHNERGTDTVYYCDDLKMTYHVNSSD